MDEEKCWRSTEGPVISKRKDTMDSRGRKATQLKGNICVNWEEMSVNWSQTQRGFELEQAPSCWSSVQLGVRTKPEKPVF